MVVFLQINFSSQDKVPDKKTKMKENNTVFGGRVRRTWSAQMEIWMIT